MNKIKQTDQKEEIIRIRGLREGLGYSQEQFADLLGINISTYKKMEAYDRRISLDNLKALHRKLNVSSDYILFGDKVPLEQAWSGVLNCTEVDRIILFLRLFRYLCQSKPDLYPVDGEGAFGLEEMARALEDIQDTEEYREE